MPDYQIPQWRKLPLRKNCRFEQLAKTYDQHKNCLNRFAKKQGLKPYQVGYKRN